jgi:hypothetical protein
MDSAMIPRAFARHDLEVIGFAPDHDADGDIAVIVAGQIGKGNGGGDFQRARHSDDFRRMARGLDGGLGARDQLVVQVVVEAGFDDEKLGHVWFFQSMGRSPAMDRP